MNSDAMKKLITVYQNLSQEWNHSSRNLEKCGEYLNSLKILLLEISFMPTGQEGVNPSKQELLIARDILEIGAQWSIQVRDIPSFERYMSQLKTYYFDYQKDLPESSYKNQLLGLNLLSLLAQNKLAEFHTELELLPVQTLSTNVYIRHPVSIEQYLMEGSYNKVFLSKGNVPAESYKYFIDILLTTIRSELASCIEEAYEKIGFGEASRMLFFDDRKQTENYATERGWKIDADGTLGFTKSKKQERIASLGVKEPVPALDLARQAIGYAKELESIV